MAALIKTVLEELKYYFVDRGDPRVEHYPFMDNPLYIIILLVIYNQFVFKWGPTFMEKRKPYELKHPMLLYNLLQVIANGYFVVEAFRLIWIPNNYSLTCEEVDYSYEFLPLKVLFYTYLFLWTKILDLIDTVFMVLRKKSNQVSFLHVYHHTGMVLASWICCKYVGGGHAIFFGTVNAFVHTVMYSYYFLTALYPEYKKSIWWKKHITELQLIQFVVTSVHSLIALFNPYCGFPKLLLALFIPQDIFMFFLFLDFYRKAYLLKKNVETDTKVNGEKTKQR